MGLGLPGMPVVFSVQIYETWTVLQMTTHGIIMNSRRNTVAIANSYIVAICRIFKENNIRYYYVTQVQERCLEENNLSLMWM